MSGLHLTWRHGALDDWIALLGKIEIGWVWPEPNENSWSWQASLGDETLFCLVPTEQAAKDAVTTCVAEWLRDAGLEQVKGAGE
jgi:hypothetical protein